MDLDDPVHNALGRGKSPGQYDDIPKPPSKGPSKPSKPDKETKMNLDEPSNSNIIQTLAEAGGTASQAAASMVDKPEAEENKAEEKEEEFREELDPPSDSRILYPLITVLFLLGWLFKQ